MDPGHEARDDNDTPLIDVGDAIRFEQLGDAVEMRHAGADLLLRRLFHAADLVEPPPPPSRARPAGSRPRRRGRPARCRPACTATPPQTMAKPSRARPAAHARVGRDAAREHRQPDRHDAVAVARHAVGDDRRRRPCSWPSSRRCRRPRPWPRSRRRRDDHVAGLRDHQRRQDRQVVVGARTRRSAPGRRSAPSPDRPA